MSKAERAAAIVKYMASEGYIPELDKDGDVRLKCEGLTFYIELLEDDETYYRLVLPNFWSIDTEEERGRAIIAANSVADRIKAAKVIMVRDDMWATLEGFYPSVDRYLPVIARCIKATRAAAMRFGEEMMGKAE